MVASIINFIYLYNFCFSIQKVDCYYKNLYQEIIIFVDKIWFTIIACSMFNLYSVRIYQAWLAMILRLPHSFHIQTGLSFCCPVLVCLFSGLPFYDPFMQEWQCEPVHSLINSILYLQHRNLLLFHYFLIFQIIFVY